MTRLNDLQFEAMCTNCYTQSVGCDDTSCWCEACGATWDADGTNGEVSA